MEKMSKLKKFAAAALSVCLAAMELPVMPAGVKAAEPIEPPDFSFIGAVGDLTAEESIKAAEATYIAIASHAPRVDYGTYGLDMTVENSDSFIAIFNYVRSCFDVGICTSRSGVSYSPMGDDILLDYRFEDSEYDEKLSEYMAVLDDIIAPVKPSWSDEEKALYLHEYIASNYDYDYPAYYGMVTRTAEEQYSAFGMLKNGMAVCEGYAGLYAMLLNRIGIPSKLVTSKNLGHAWNAVLIDSEWYHTDVTWDDQYYGYDGFIKHDNLLTTALELKTSSSPHNSSDWQDSFLNDMNSSAEPSVFDGAFWKNLEKPIQRYQNNWVALTGTGVDVKFVLFDYDSESHSAQITSLTENLNYSLSEWDVPDKPGYVWGETYIIPVVVNDILYFSTPKAIYSYHNGKFIELHHITDEEAVNNRIYGLSYKDGKLLYGLDYQRRSRNDVLATPVNHYSLDLSELEAKVISEAGSPSIKENNWISPLKISNWKAGETPSVPTASAKYGEPEFSFYNAADDTLLSGAPSEAGNYYVIARVAGTSEYEELISEKVFFKVADMTVNIIVPDTTVIYTQLPLFNVQIDGELSSEEKSAIKDSVTPKADYTGVGTYPIEVTFDETAFPEYTFSYSLGNLIVKPREPVLVTADGETSISIPYSGEKVTLSPSLFATDNDDSDIKMSFEWSQKNEAGIYTDLEEAPVHCGEYKVVATINETANYTSQSIELDVNITRVNLTVEVEDQTITYGDVFSGNVKVKYTGLFEADNELFPEELLGTTTYEGNQAGEYELGATFPKTSDYSYTIKKGTLTVKKKALNVTTENAEITYGEVSPLKVKVIYDGLITSDEAVFIDEFGIDTEYKKYDPVGTYKIKPQLPVFANYEVVLTEGTLTVNPKQVNVLWPDVLSFVYDGTEKMVIPTVSGTVNDDDVSATLSDYKATNAGTYTAEITSLSSSNYTLGDDTKSVEWTIKKAVLTIYPKMKSIYYGDDIGETEIVAEGLAESDDITVIKETLKLVTSYEKNKPVGDYDMMYDSLPTADNYSVVLEKSILSVLPKELELVWDETTDFVYDGSEKSVSAELVGIVGNDEVTIEYKNNKASEVGKYRAEATISGKDKANYKVSLVYYNEWEITEAPLDYIVPKALSLVYNGTLQKLVSEGKVSGGEISYSLNGSEYSAEIPAAVNAGQYFVSYQIVSDSQHSGSAAGNIPVKILPMELSESGKKPLLNIKHDGFDDSVPEITVVVDGKTLAEETDYSFTYDNSFMQGTGKLTVSFKGNYSGNYSEEYPVEKHTTSTVTELTTTATTTSATTSATSSTTTTSTTTTTTTTTSTTTTTTTTTTATTSTTTTTTTSTTTTETTTASYSTTTSTSSESTTNPTSTTITTKISTTSADTTTATEITTTKGDENTTTESSSSSTQRSETSFVSVSQTMTVTTVTTSSTTESTSTSDTTGTTSTATTTATTTSSPSDSSTTASTTTTTVSSGSSTTTSAEDTSTSTEAITTTSETNTESERSENETTTTIISTDITTSQSILTTTETEATSTTTVSSTTTTITTLTVSSVPTASETSSITTKGSSLFTTETTTTEETTTTTSTTTTITTTETTTTTTTTSITTTTTSDITIITTSSEEITTSSVVTTTVKTTSSQEGEGTSSSTVTSTVTSTVSDSTTSSSVTNSETSTETTSASTSELVSTETTTVSTTENQPVTTTEPVQAIEFGDATGDSKVDAKDASKVLAIYAAYSTGSIPEEITDELIAAIDVNGDGQLDAKDASDILSYYSFLSTGGALSFRSFLESKKS